MPEQRKRCPNGTRRNKKTGKCEKYDAKRKTKKVVKKKTIEKKKKQCPPEKPLLNPRTNRCLKDTQANRKKLETINMVNNIVSSKKERKQCPPEKPLLNPRTNRCIKDTQANRKKIEEVNNILDNERAKQDPIIKNKSIKSTPKKSTKTTTTKQKVRVPLSPKTYEVKNCPGAIFNDIDINKVFIGRDKNNKEGFYYQHRSRAIPLTEKELLGNGGYGSVYRLYSKNAEINVALKTYYDKKDDEIYILKELEKNKVDCNLLSCKLLKKDDGEYVSICELYTNNLSNMTDILKQMTVKEKMQIFKQLVNDLNCLYKKKFIYTDIKMENTLYKCYGNNKVKIAFGDLGSICKRGDRNTATYPAWEFRDEPGDVACNENSMIWSLGVLFLTMLLNTNFIRDFIYSVIINVPSIQEYIKIKEKILSKWISSGIKNNKLQYYKLKDLILHKRSGFTVYDLLNNMLMADHNRRMSLRDVVMVLNKV